MTGCRIARVRDKATGRTIEILPQVRRDEIAADLVRGAVEIAAAPPGTLAGFAIVAIHHDGFYEIGSSLQRDFWMGPTLFTAALSEILRREITTGAEIASFCVRQGWLRED